MHLKQEQNLFSFMGENISVRGTKCNISAIYTFSVALDTTESHHFVRMLSCELETLKLSLKTGHSLLVCHNLNSWWILKLTGW